LPFGFSQGHRRDKKKEKKSKEKVKTECRTPIANSQKLKAKSQPPFTVFQKTLTLTRFLIKNIEYE